MLTSLSFASIRSNNPMINCSICQLNGALLCRWICIFNRVSHCTALSFFRAAVRYTYSLHNNIPMISFILRQITINVAARITHSFIYWSNSRAFPFTIRSIKYNNNNKNNPRYTRDKPANKEWGNDPSLISPLPPPHRNDLFIVPLNFKQTVWPRDQMVKSLSGESPIPTVSHSPIISRTWSTPKPCDISIGIAESTVFSASNYLLIDPYL